VSKVRGPVHLSTLIATRAASDLEQCRRAATFWWVVEVVLLVPAAVAAAAALLGATGAVEAHVAERAAVAAVILAGAYVVIDIPARAQRAQVGIVYLEAFVAQTADVPESDEALTDLRRWFVRINAALLMGALQVDPLLLVPSPAEPAGST
jgi:hypothetical protein